MRAPALLLALLVAGCVAPAPMALPGPAGILVVDVGTGTYEPSMGIGEDGALFITATAHTNAGKLPGVWRSLDGGATWEETMDDEQRAPGSADPWLWSDHASGRVFNAELQPGACSWLTWTDDLGETWERNVAGGCGLPAHHFQKLTSGPPPPGVSTKGYPSVLYYSSTSLRDPDPMRPTDLIVGGTGTDVAVSLDGGSTFSAPVRVHEPTPGSYSQAGPVAVGPDGTAWSPGQTNEGVRIERTRDAGASWEPVATLHEAGYLPYGSDPSLVVDASGTLFLLHPSKEGASVLRASLDGGATWTAPRSIAPPEVNATVLPILRVLRDGTVVAAYLGTTADASAWNGDASFAPPKVAWHLYLALIEDAAGDDPRITTLIADEDPVQRGCVWLRGGLSPPCRNLGDFLGLDAQGGLVAVAFVDGCDACPEGRQSAGTKARVALWRPFG